LPVPTGWEPVFEQAEVKIRLEMLDYQIRNTVLIERHVYPPPEQVFRALKEMSPDEVQVVIIGQDPYHNGNAEGLAFSVPADRKLNPSLTVILEAVKAQGGTVRPNFGSLTHWSEQKVLLLNTALTVQEGLAGSHTKLWAPVSTALVKFLAESPRPLVWLLWGQHAQAMKPYLLNRGDHPGETHVILEAPHPSPLAGDKFARAQKNSPHFFLANAALKKWGRKEIDWSVGGAAATEGAAATSST
jgi:uracil-DNA glycosylase